MKPIYALIIISALTIFGCKKECSPNCKEACECMKNNTCCCDGLTCKLKCDCKGCNH